MMLTVSEAINQRRSIRSFRSDPVSDDAIYAILEAARLAPSGSNRQPWRFIVVTDKDEKKRLRKICFDQAFIEEAPVVFVCCVDLAAYAKAAREKRSQEFIDYGVIETLSGYLADPAVRELFLNAPDTDLNVHFPSAMANTYIAAEHMVLTATALGLGSCWVGAIGSAEEMNALFHLPPNTLAVAVLPVGHPVKIPPPRPRISLDSILLRPLHTRP
ncbi:MAG: nitroreductase family protein [Chloroflexi bacterium]|nr:nitroreductase family protein [Chloroflexota bacterium]